MSDKKDKDGTRPKVKTARSSSRSASTSSRSKDRESKEYRCITCKGNILESDKALSCDSCQEWECIKCSKMSEALYDLIREGGDNANLKFNCTHCKDPIHLMASMNTNIQMVLQNQQKADKTLGDLNDRMDRFEKTIEDKIDRKIEQGIARSVDKAVSDKIRQGIAEEVRACLKETREREHRTANFMIFNSTESASEDNTERKEHDKTAVKDICEAIGITSLDIKNIIRIGKKGDKSRPIKVTVGDPKQQKEILKNAKKLKNHPSLGKIGLSPDLTADQRKERKALVEELDRRKEAGEDDLIIISNRIVRKTEKKASKSGNKQQPNNTQDEGAGSLHEEEPFRY